MNVYGFCTMRHVISVCSTELVYTGQGGSRRCVSGVKVCEFYSFVSFEINYISFCLIVSFEYE